MVKQVRIKAWLLKKNNMFASCSNQIREGRYTENSWLTVTKETEKAYHLDETQMYIPSGGWIPKSAVLEVREVEESAKINSNNFYDWMEERHKRQVQELLEEADDN